jgi:hypothetical protein
MKNLRSLSLKLAMALGIGVTSALTTLPAQAAEDITFITPFLGARSISLDKLENFAEGGKPRGDLRTILEVADQDYDDAREFLQKPIPFSLLTADRILNSRPGEAILAQLGAILAPRRSNRGGDVALRSALILSLADDGQFTILELIEKYPTDARVNVQALIDAGEQFGDIANFVETFTGPN